ncbi:unnamed protein product [Prunus armeniaca]
MSDKVNTTSYNSIEILTGSNYLKWKEELEISLGLMDYDIALKWDALKEPAADATADVKRKYERWEKANRMGTLIMLKTMTPSLRGSIPRSDCAKDFLVAIGQKFKESDKGEKGVQLNKFTEIKYDGRGGPNPSSTGQQPLCPHPAPTQSIVRSSVSP